MAKKKSALEEKSSDEQELIKCTRRLNKELFQKKGRDNGPTKKTKAFVRELEDLIKRVEDQKERKAEKQGKSSHDFSDGDSPLSSAKRTLESAKASYEDI